MQQIIEDGCEDIGEASLQGRLFDLGRYPGLVENDTLTDLVIGECFRLKDSKQVLADFDAYEECNDEFEKPWLYQRQLRKCSLKSGKMLQAWVYIYNRTVDGKTHIQSGDYLAYLQEQQVD
jgi:gamma-glutamylcyclotransferase (GGCT)/AIG2-like uncharacterized protein YtfP